MTQEINLLNPIFRKKQSSYTSPVAIAASIGAAMALMLVYGIYESMRLGPIEAQARSVAKMLSDMKAQQEASLTPRKPSPQLDATVADLANDLKARREVVDALKNGTVGSTTGFSEYLRAFSRQRVEGVWLTSFDIRAGGADLTIAGRTLSADLVPAYLQRLNKETPMQGRQFASVAINRPAPQVKPAEKDAPPQPAVPPFLEFMISSDDPRTRSAAAAPAPKPQGSLALRAPLEAEMRGQKAPTQ